MVLSIFLTARSIQSKSSGVGSEPESESSELPLSESEEISLTKLS